MKFGNIYWQNPGMENSDIMSINIGDNLQFMTVDYLYSTFLPEVSEVVKLQQDELKFYQGEDLILPLNWGLFDPRFMDENKIAISENILPVFLGMTIESAACKETYFNNYNIAYLKRFEPIGCRDEHTMRILHKHNIRAYLNGCMTSILPMRRNKDGDKIFFVDAPNDLKNYIPKEIAGKYEIMTQQYYLHKSTAIEDILDRIKMQYCKYANEAKLVVTSRLHVASPCMAMGIPVIFAKDQVDARFGWIDKYIPLYSKEDYERIDWNPKPVEYEENKRLLIQNAVRRIRSVYEEYSIAHKVNELYGDREKKAYISYQKTIYNNFEKAILYLKNNYKKEDKFDYSIWGVNNAAEQFYEYMFREYPNAKLRNVIDAYKEIKFHGVYSIKPDDFCCMENEVIFVLPVKASNEAEKIFKKKGVDIKHYVCCGNQFLSVGEDFQLVQNNSKEIGE